MSYLALICVDRSGAAVQEAKAYTLSGPVFAVSWCKTTRGR